MLRRCFLPPLPEHDLAASLLSQAADALLERNLLQAADLIRRSDLRFLEDYRYKVAGPLDPAIHRIAKFPVYARSSQTMGRRMPTMAVTREVFARDGYRCRFCGSKVIVKEARKVFINALPTVVRWAGTNRGCHFGLAVLSASIDHVVPFQRGGRSEDLANLVTACNPCQFGRGHCLLDEVELEDPTKYAPVIDDWDGLTRLRAFRLHRDQSSDAEVSCR
jgi:5-methylcytosine-specific restriction endonuclease McrA